MYSENYDYNDYCGYDDDNDYERDTFYALTDGMYGDYDEWRENGADGAAADEGKSEFDVVLKDAGAQKIAVIKAVKEATGLGLGEAKALVEAKGVIKESATKEEADKIIARFKEVGCTVVAE